MSIRYICKSCGKQFNVKLQEDLERTKDLPRILLYDIETAPMEVYVWGLFKQYIPHDNIIKDWFVLSWAAKWLYDDNIISGVVTPTEAKNRDDKRILKGIWKLLDEADICIGHNLDRFDDRKLKARFIKNDLNPPSFYRTIDTLKVAKRNFAFVSYKQDYLTKYFNLNEKINTSELGGFDLWKRCVQGEQIALDHMIKYNNQDVRGLEDVYLKLRPYIKNHPNLGVIMGDSVCPNCGSSHLEEEYNKFYYTSANKFQIYRCMNCKTPNIRFKKNLKTHQTEMRSVP
jgi:transposase-like protein